VARFRVATYLEIGKSRTFAGALDWPGWCRAGRDTDAALDALLEYGRRYARVLKKSGLRFTPAAEKSAFDVVERVTGDASTEFGVPGGAPSVDAPPVDEADLRRLTTVLQASWRAFDAAVAEAAETPLRRGPRGGGRDLDKIVEHVVGAERGYLAQLDWKLPAGDSDTRAAILAALQVRREQPPPGPRGGARWSPRYFVRRVAWHVLDHAWEIEDRAQQPADR
jgi:hypothetical protein